MGIEDEFLRAARLRRQKFFPSSPRSLQPIRRARRILPPDCVQGLVVIEMADEPVLRPTSVSYMVVPPADDEAQPAPPGDGMHYPLVEYHVETQARRRSARMIMRETAMQEGFFEHDLTSSFRGRELVACRHRAIWRVAMAFPERSLPALGRLFGNRDHTTILYSIREMDAALRAGGQQAYFAELLEWGELTMGEAQIAWDQGYAEARRVAGLRVKAYRNAKSRPVDIGDR